MELSRFSFAFQMPSHGEFQNRDASQSDFHWTKAMLTTQAYRQSNHVTLADILLTIPVLLQNTFYTVKTPCDFTGH